MRYCKSAGLALGLALAVLVLARAQVAQGASALKDSACTCERDLPYQLLRGPDQVSRCKDGYYCDCKAGKVLHCFNILLKFKYNEDPQVCDLNFDCQKFFDNLPTTTVTPATTPRPTTRPTPPPTTRPTPRPTTRPTPPPTTRPTPPPTTRPTPPPTTRPTPPPTTKPTPPPTNKPTPTTRPTARPTTAPTAVPSPTTSAPVDPFCLTCDPVKHQRYQLIRGDHEVEKCNERIYCDCEERTQLQCAWFEALNPDDQKCDMFFSCSSWLDEHPWQ